MFQILSFKFRGEVRNTSGIRFHARKHVRKCTHAYREDAVRTQPVYSPFHHFRCYDRTSRLTGDEMNYFAHQALLN